MIASVMMIVCCFMIFYEVSGPQFGLEVLSELNPPHLLMKIRLEIEAILVPDLNPADMQRIDESLNSLGIAPWRCSEREDTEMRVHRHHVTDDLRVGVVPCPFVSLV